MRSPNQGSAPSAINALRRVEALTQPDVTDTSGMIGYERYVPRDVRPLFDEPQGQYQSLVSHEELASIARRSIQNLQQDKDTRPKRHLRWNINGLPSIAGHRKMIIGTVVGALLATGISYAGDINPLGDKKTDTSTSYSEAPVPEGAKPVTLDITALPIGTMDYAFDAKIVPMHEEAVNGAETREPIIISGSVTPSLSAAGRLQVKIIPFSEMQPVRVSGDKLYVDRSGFTYYLADFPDFSKQQPACKTNSQQEVIKPKLGDDDSCVTLLPSNFVFDSAVSGLSAEELQSVKYYTMFSNSEEAHSTNAIKRVGDKAEVVFQSTDKTPQFGVCMTPAQALADDTLAKFIISQPGNEDKEVIFSDGSNYVSSDKVFAAQPEVQKNLQIGNVAIDSKSPFDCSEIKPRT